MHFTTALSVLAVAAAAVAHTHQCATCPETLPAGFEEIAWKFVAAADEAGTMFCGYQGKKRGSLKLFETFCSYYNRDGMIIENPDDLCPETVKVEEC
ncbi:hypothetical protein B0H17DRAFT_1326562 [Mycena rosella]|uniref:Uncharacterized protein n=1 Tax=Mycena rosella TaxID=1033263 RepID=A0AAD7GSL3_MYCRO|nr:hypothetical protein B0H17DRAFT_1326562 [Mycena rosella]